MPRLAAAPLALALLAALPGAARAQQPAGGEPAVGAAPEVRRDGFFLGASLGLGSQRYSADGYEDLQVEGAGLGVHLGGMLTSQLALAIELAYLSGESDETGDGPDVVIWQRQIGAWLRYWPIPRLWLQGGLASLRAGARANGVEGPKLKGAALTAAVGFEAVHQDTFALDVLLRVGGGDFSDSASDPDDLTTATIALLASLSWYP
ncbi:MAG TPA: hypothetical protein VKZ63_01835 [Kofleriaceae bacterium]|nr:hypothetical protein [Kofleriaceae bacterium]